MGVSLVKQAVEEMNQLMHKFQCISTLRFAAPLQTWPTFPHNDSSSSNTLLHSVADKLYPENSEYGLVDKLPGNCSRLPYST